MDIVDQGSLSRDFKIDGRSLIPIVMSHNLSGSSTSISIMCRDLASHGYIVFAIDHHDGSCCYTEDAKGKPIFYNEY